jgi:hypothetical protein
MGLLSACTGTTSQPPPMPPQARWEEPRWRLPPHARTVPRPAHKPLLEELNPTPPAQPGPAAAQPGLKTTQPGAAAAGTLTAVTPLAAPPESGELVGLDQQKAIHLFGRAAEKLERPPATVWRYKAPNCQLDLFFYLDLRSGRMRTLHYAFKGDVGNVEKRQDCLRAIVAARAARAG